MRYSFLTLSTFVLTAALAVNLSDARGPGDNRGGGGGNPGARSGGGPSQGGGQKPGGGQGQGQGKPRISSGVPGGNAPRLPNANGPNIPNAPRINPPGNNAPGTGVIPGNNNGPRTPNTPRINPPGNSVPGTGVIPGTNNGPRNLGPRNNPINNLPNTGNNANNNNNDGRPNRINGNLNGGVNTNRDGRDGNGNNTANSPGRGNDDGRRYSHQTFHHGYWNHPGANNNFNNRNFNNQNNNAAQGPRGYSRLYGGYGGSGYGYGNGGYGNYGYGNGGYGNGGGGNGLGTLLGIGLALSGYGNGFGLGGSGYGGGIGGYGQGYGMGGYGGYGLYGGYPIGWGLGGGGLGGLAYNSGYLPYSNPYYASNMGGYSYAQPIPTAVVANENPTSSQLFDTSLAQFKSGDYQGALVSVDNAIQQNPSDPAMHEFRALTLFALKNYAGAAATIHSVLAVGPGWNWDTVSSLYADTDVYEAQLRELEQTTEAKPGQADTHFLLAYHYMVTGHPDAASRQLTRVVKASPNDRLAADLLKMNDANSTAANQPADATPPAPTQPAAAPKSIDPATLVGTWHASREDGSKFDLQLAEDKTFTWKVNQDGREQTLKGTYDLQKDLLALESPDAGGMVAQVTQNDDGHFTFKMLGAPQDDKGLAFAK